MRKPLRGTHVRVCAHCGASWAIWEHRRKILCELCGAPVYYIQSPWCTDETLWPKLWVVWSDYDKRWHWNMGRILNEVHRTVH